MVFIETSMFTKLIKKMISDEEYYLLQLKLTDRPTAGDIIQGSGGLRKLRWTKFGHGKRGGIRVIYYFITKEDQIYMLYAYSKNKSEDLTTEQLKQLKSLVEEQLS